VAQAIFTLPVDRGVIKEKGWVPRASRKGSFFVFYKRLFSLLPDQGFQWFRREANPRKVDETDKGILANSSSRTSSMLGKEAMYIGSGSYFTVTQSVRKSGGWTKVCMTTQYCSVFSRNPRNCSGVAWGAEMSNRRRMR